MNQSELIWIITVIAGLVVGFATGYVCKDANSR